MPRGAVEETLAAPTPAILYYLVLFLQVDAIAGRFNLAGLPRSELPKIAAVLVSGWVFILPLGVLIYFLFGLGYNPGLSALYACVALLGLDGRVPRPAVGGPAAAASRWS